MSAELETIELTQDTTGTPLKYYLMIGQITWFEAVNDDAPAKVHTTCTASLGVKESPKQIKQMIAEVKARMRYSNGNSQGR